MYGKLFLYSYLNLNKNSKRRSKMPINQTETNLEAITITIAYLEKKSDADEELLKRLKNERMHLLQKLNVL